MSNENKQTAVEWLAEQMLHPEFYNPYIEQALEMEKAKIVKAFDDGDWNYHYSRKTGNDFENGEEYFEELYGGDK